MADECLNILLVESNGSAARPILDLLDQMPNMHVNVECADGLDAATASLAARHFQFVMLDLSEGNGGGPALLSRLKTAAPAMPLIVFTKSVAESADYASVVQSGTCEFLTRESMNSEEICRSIKYMSALERIKILEATNKNQAQVSCLIQAVATALDTTDSLEVMLHNCAQALVDALDASFTRIWTFDPKEDMLVLQASAGLYTHIDGKHSRIPLGFLKIGRIAAERKPHLTNSVLTDSWVSDPEWAAKQGMVSFAGYPLLIGEKLCGVIGMFSQHPLSDATLAGLSAVSTIIANCIVRKRTELDLLSQFQYLNSWLDASVDALSVLDLNGVIIYTNPASERISGISHDQMVGKCISELVVDPERSMEALQQTLAVGSINEFLAHIRTGSGGVVECLINASVYKDKQGRTAGVILSVRDATQRLQEEEKLRHFASIFEHSNDSIMTRTLDGIVTSWNQGSERVYGYTSDEILGKSISLIIPKDLSDEFQSILEKLRKGEPVDHLETKRLKKNGELIDVALSISPLKDAAGNIVGASAISRDITEKKQLERMLEFRETLFREICSGALDGIFCMDDTGKVTVWNGAAEKIFGYRAAEIIGKDIHHVLAPSGLSARYSAEIERFASTGEGSLVGKIVELEAIRADRGMVPIELSVSSFQLNGKWNAVGVARDISERREIQARLKESKEALEAEHNSIAEANKMLSVQAEELQSHGAQMEYLTQLGEYLQVCATDEETHEVIGQFGGKLFPDTSGELLIFKESKNWIVRVASWGEHVAARTGFPVGDCWSIRLGQPHLYNNGKPGPRCPHIAPDVIGCLCVPLVLMGEIFGIMHVEWKKTVDQEDEKLVTRLTGDAALALTNLRLRKQLEDLSIRDPLTGLFNRRYLEEFFAQELIRSRRKSGALSVVMLDIDHFKRFNDTYGHEAGDAVLYELGKFFKREMRGSDVTCRYGGEEFIVLLPETTVDTAMRRAEQLRKSVKSLHVKFIDQILPEINLSMGVASFPGHGDSMEELIRKADMALYAAKEEGRDRVCVAPARVDSIEHSSF